MLFEERERGRHKLGFTLKAEKSDSRFEKTEKRVLFIYFFRKKTEKDRIFR